MVSSFRANRSQPCVRFNGGNSTNATEALGSANMKIERLGNLTLGAGNTND